MKLRSIVAVLVFLVARIAFATDTQRDFGMMFQMKNLLLSIDSFNDGYQAGVGVKWWPAKTWAMRGLFGFTLNTLNDVTWTDLGASVGFEYHRVRGDLSPYGGGFLGAHAVTGAGAATAFFFGGLVGAEMMVWKNLGIFAEYTLLASIDENGFTMGTAAGGGAQLGLIIYF